MALNDSQPVPDLAAESAPDQTLVQPDDLGAPGLQEVPTPVAKRKFDPRKNRERVRGGLAAAAFGLFALVVLALGYAVIIGHRKWDELEGMTTALLPAVVSVVSSITGFYFGAKSGDDQ